MAIPKIDANTGYKATAGAVLLSAVAYYLGYRRISYLTGTCGVALAALSYMNQKTQKSGTAAKTEKDSSTSLEFTKFPTYVKSINTLESFMRRFIQAYDQFTPQELIQPFIRSCISLPLLQRSIKRWKQCSMSLKEN
jgi:hypothetical protein